MNGHWIRCVWTSRLCSRSMINLFSFQSYLFFYDNGLRENKDDDDDKSYHKHLRCYLLIDSYLFGRMFARKARQMKWIELFRSKWNAIADHLPSFLTIFLSIRVFFFLYFSVSIHLFVCVSNHNKNNPRIYHWAINFNCC